MNPVRNEGTFVNKIAAIMIPISGITAWCTILSAKIRIPQTISMKAMAYIK